VARVVTGHRIELVDAFSDNPLRGIDGYSHHRHTARRKRLGNGSAAVTPTATNYLRRRIV
jgi:hypothetical protein